MANRTIGELTAAGAITGAEELHIVQGGNSRRVTLDEIAAALAGITSAQTYAMPFKGAMVSLAADLTAVTYPLLVPWSTVSYDTEGFFSAGDPTRFVIPAGVKKIRLQAGIQFPAGAGEDYGAYISFTKNGALQFLGNAVSNVRQSTSGYTDNIYSITSAVLAVSEGDYFELRTNTPSPSVIPDVRAGGYTYFALEVIEFTPPAT